METTIDAGTDAGTDAGIDADNSPIEAARTILREAAAVIRRGWVQHKLATDDAGRSVPPDSTRATHWCAIGALCLVSKGASSATMLRVGGILHSLTGARWIAGWNNAIVRTQEQVVATFELAAENVGKQFNG